MALTLPQDDTVYSIMLVADGEPKHGGLTPMNYRSEVRSVLHDLYSSQRKRVIEEATARANDCRRGMPAYVMTTGFGAVPVASTLNVYNVPGERSIHQQEYQNRYEQSFLRILPPYSEKIKKVVIVYYAGITKQAFREGVFDLLRKLAGDPNVARSYEVHACMYGARWHYADKWNKLCAIFNALSTGDTHTLDQLKRDWKTRYEKIAPFFEWF